MSSHYGLYNRQYGSKSALAQHLQDSPAHKPSFDCEDCDRRFGSQEALQQHIQNSPAHKPSFDCEDCNKRFSSENALQQHLQNSPAHKPSFDCEDCDRRFGSEEALQKHLQNAPVHKPSFDCQDCNKRFGSEEALKQHLQNSPAHALSFDCENCPDKRFGSQEALQQHLRDSPAHQYANTATPLDIFFSSFPTFNYDPSLPPATSYAKLRKHKGWRRDNDAAAKVAWNRYQDALESELRMWYGDEDDLTAWHVLCRAIGIKPLPHTCKQCEEAVRRTHVNIVDLIEWGRARGSGKGKVQTFRYVEDLKIYTKRTGKIFPNTLDQNDGNVVLRHLLRKIFRGGI